MAGIAEERFAFVTGGANGIGKALYHKLASRGISVVVVDIDTGSGTMVPEDVAGRWNVQCNLSNAMFQRSNRLSRLLPRL